jgi:Spy/CpxP family protein refolding chaperone
MKTSRILLATALAAGTILLPAAGASAATPDPGPAFGQHVSGCAKTMGGSSGGHNPGMHQGKTGSAGMTSTMTMSMQTMSMH